MLKIPWDRKERRMQTPSTRQALTENQFKRGDLKRRRRELLLTIGDFFSWLDLRFAAVFKIVVIKSGTGLATYDPSREKEKMAMIHDEARDLIKLRSANRIWRVIIALAKAWQDQLRGSIREELSGDPEKLLENARSELDEADRQLIDSLDRWFSQIQKIREIEDSLNGRVPKDPKLEQIAEEIVRDTSLRHLPIEFVLPVLKVVDEEARKK